MKPVAANAPYRLPPPLWSARCKACWFTTAVLVLVVASFWSLDLQWAQFLSIEAARSMGRFLGEFFPPDTSPEFLRRVAIGTWETLAMSGLGTLLAAAGGLLLALPASRAHEGHTARWRLPTRLLLNALRSIPELVWAGLLLIAAGLGPFAGTLALAMHTTGVLGRLFAEAVENSPPGPGAALHAAAGAAAADELHAVPLGEQHPRRRRAGRGGRRGPGAAAGLPHGPVPHGQDGHHPGRHAAAGGAGGCAELRRATLDDPVTMAWLPALTVGQAWGLLAVAIGFEVAGTTCMRLSEGFSRWLPSVLIFVFYAASFALNTLIIGRLGLSVVYAVWSGVGTVATALIGILYFKEPATALKMASITLVVVGVFGLHAASRSAAA